MFEDIVEGNITIDTVARAASCKLVPNRSVVDAAIFHDVSYNTYRFFKELSHEGSNLHYTYKSKGDYGIDECEVLRKFVGFSIKNGLDSETIGRDYLKFVRENVGGVYAIINEYNGKRYIGQASVLYSRLQGEKNQLKNASGHINKNLLKDYIKQDGDGFRVEILEFVYPFDEPQARDLERIEISKTPLDKLYNIQLRRCGRAKEILKGTTVPHAMADGCSL